MQYIIIIPYEEVVRCLDVFKFRNILANVPYMANAIMANRNPF